MMRNKFKILEASSSEELEKLIINFSEVWIINGMQYQVISNQFGDRYSVLVVYE